MFPICLCVCKYTGLLKYVCLICFIPRGHTSFKNKFQKISMFLLGHKKNLKFQKSKKILKMQRGMNMINSEIIKNWCGKKSK